MELDDISKALESLDQLSSDFKIIETGNKKVIVSSTVEFKSDSLTLLKMAEENGGWITFKDLKSKMPNFDSRERFN